MPELSENEFLSQLNAIVEKNISNEAFGVSELADAMNMSRSNLLRKVKKETSLSVTQLISKVRLTRAMELMKSEFETTTWRAFWECVAEGRPPDEVAAELGVSVNAVYVAKSRVLARLRQELDGLVD